MFFGGFHPSFVRKYKCFGYSKYFEKGLWIFTRWPCISKITEPQWWKKICCNLYCKICDVFFYNSIADCPNYIAFCDAILWKSFTDSLSNCPSKNHLLTNHICYAVVCANYGHNIMPLSPALSPVFYMFYVTKIHFFQRFSMEWASKGKLGFLFLDRYPWVSFSSVA